MDTSKEYIKMCEKAEEIQQGWKPKNGDYLIAFNEVRLLQENIRCYYAFYLSGYKYSIIQHGFLCARNFDDNWWLPRQDQLQEMVDVKSAGDFSDALINMHEAFMDGMKDYYRDLPSMEQLWLAFVMKEKYQKTWNGDIWSV